MIQAVFYRDSDGDCQSFQIKGHAGFEEAGRDIICAAVSALAVNTVNSIETLTGTKTEASEKSGCLTCRLKDGKHPEPQLLVNSLILGLKNIEEEYGTKYIRILIEEV